MASPSNPPSSRWPPAGSPPISSASRTRHPKNADAESHSRVPATHNRYPAAPLSASGIPQSRPPPLALSPHPRPGLLRSPSASPLATSLPAPYSPQKNSSSWHTSPSSSNRTSARAPSSSPRRPPPVPSAKNRSPRPPLPLP